jgi:ribonucleotide reductase alpha subunit
MFSFRLPAGFVAGYANRPVDWGFTDAGGNALGEITFIRTYSRMKTDGTKERWHEVCERVINGMFSIQKDHAQANRLPWSDEHALESATEAYERMFTFKWLPPGRGLWMMGTDYVMRNRNSAALNNCCYVSTSDFDVSPSEPFTFLMEASMLGIGVGYDTKLAEKGHRVHAPSADDVRTFVIPDSREGWVESVGKLLDSYLLPGQPSWVFDYSQVRPAGAPIKGFGGTSAGPEPLERLHRMLTKVLTAKVGSTIDTELTVDIGNMIGVCVVAGNVRRSALIALGSPADESFVHLKDPKWYPERNSYDRENPGWGWMSNNSVVVSPGDDYSKLVGNIALNGEPGLIWLDVAREFGRLADGPNGKDHRVAGFNPCLAGETLIHTTNGPRRIDSLTEPFWAVVDGKAYKATASWQSGVKDIFRLSTDEGYEVLLTDNHQVLTASGEWVAAGELVAGDAIRIHDQRNIPGWSGEGSFEEGYLLGLFVGDGGFEGDNPVVKVWAADEGSAGVAEAAIQAAATMPRRSDWAGWRDHGRGYQVMTLSRDLPTRFGLDRSKVFGEQLQLTSSEFQRGFLRGFFDTDGHVETNSAKGSSVRLGQSDRSRLVAVQQMLLRLGIKSRIYKGRDAGTALLPDGKGGTAEYPTKAAWRLVISGNDIPVFADQIGFAHTVKDEKLAKLLTGQRFYSKPFTATVAGFDYVRTDAVYDLTVDDVHAMDANGLYVHNCAEQSLESYELCTLVEVFLNRHETLEDFARTIKFAYMYGKTVTLVPTHWEKTNAIMQRNRRIGTSVSGIAAFADNRGLPELRRWMDEGYATVQRWDRIYSEWLCVRESIKTTTVKPSGSVSILAGSTPGVHWAPGGNHFLRAIRFAADDPMMPLFIAAGYVVEDDVVSANTKVCYFPIRTNQKRSEKEVSIFEKMNLAAVAQRHWSDNAVSVTVSFDREEEARHIETVLHMYEGQLKTVSFLPSGKETYPQMPYTAIDAEAYDAHLGTLAQVDFGPVYDGTAGANLQAAGELYCTTDACEWKASVPASVDFEDGNQPASV